LARARGARIAYCLAVTGLLAWWLPSSRTRARLYLDPIALWSDAAARSTLATRPFINLGTLLAQQGRLAEAHDALREAKRRDPTSREAVARLRAVETLIQTRKLLTPSRQRESIEP
jgi:hypothetical protein